MSNIIKQLETIGQNAKLRYRETSIEVKDELRNTQMKAFLILPENDCKAVMVVGE